MRRNITQSSSHSTNTPAAGSGAGSSYFSHWPHPRVGASLSGMSTTAARSPAVGQVLVMPTSPRLPLLWPLPQPPLFVAAPWPQPCHTVAHPSPPCFPPLVALSTNAASSAQTYPT
jgi:hypothetical protein